MLTSFRKDYNFFIDEVRDFQSLKKWWVKYPERYNPRGKTPDAIWNFDIPTQGSWGSGYIKHFCPLPEDMIAQMLKLTTREDDVVLDCFSGSGAVLSKADNMNRKYIGFELNKEYIKMFDNYVRKTGAKKRREYEIENNNLLKQDKFQKLILDLRSLKYAKVFYKKLCDSKLKGVGKIYVDRTRLKPLKKNGLIVVKYHVLIAVSKEKKAIESKLNELINNAPLSKFGIEPRFSFYSNPSDFIKVIDNKKLFVYTSQATHKFKKKFDITGLSKSPKSDMILSKIKVDLNEKDFE